MALIEVTGLQKSYGRRQVLRGIDLHVDEGEIVGILGPNGAGKTTAVECIGGLRDRDAGTVLIAGMNPADSPPRLREVLGMQLQQCRLPARIRTREALDLFAAFYADPVPIEDLLERFGLSDRADARFDKLSGGQQQRLSVALALIGRPQIAFLDELTTGLDPAARRDIWDYLGTLRTDGVTMLLVTHFMEEAQYLCDRVIVIDDGRIVASGTPDELTRATGRQETSFTRPTDLDPAILRDLPGVTEVIERHGRVIITGDADSPQAVLGALAAHGVTVQQLRVTSPTLDEAYLTLTDEQMRRQNPKQQTQEQQP
ncbi:ABC transporter ATP-binding protein [Enemella sp. A6]|uniref:ABC transporter ATP-binding protein n=1 Tax=Enemella sp. A6 TaxID=3440152 RepID=UPI003EBAE72D